MPQDTSDQTDGNVRTCKVAACKLDPCTYRARNSMSIRKKLNHFGCKKLFYDLMWFVDIGATRLFYFSF
jgi:hypothetical protein